MQGKRDPCPSRMHATVSGARHYTPRQARGGRDAYLDVLRWYGHNQFVADDQGFAPAALRQEVVLRKPGVRLPVSKHLSQRDESVCVSRRLEVAWRLGFEVSICGRLPTHSEARGPGP